MFDKDTDEASSNPDCTAMDILRGKEEGEQRKAENLYVPSSALLAHQSLEGLVAVFCQLLSYLDVEQLSRGRGHAMVTLVLLRCLYRERERGMEGGREEERERGREGGREGGRREGGRGECKCTCFNER